MLLDRKTPTGITIPGWANTVTAAVVGAGAFDSATEGRGRFTGLLAAVDATTGLPSSFSTGIRESHAAIRAELADDELADTMFEDRPVQDFGHGHEAHVQRKLTKTRERPRSARHRLKMMTLDPMHPSRMSFLEASGQAEGAAVRAVLSSWPSASRPFTPIQWVTGFELLFGCPVTAIAQFEGSRIGSTKWTCDEYSHRLTATQVRGDH